jgi:transcriptional regulator with XRE-family HTH domain
MKKATSTKETLGHRLRQLRRDREWTQEEFAHKLGIHWQSVRRYESDLVLPTADLLKRIADSFGVSIDYLVLGDADSGSLRVQNKELLKRFQQLDRMKPDELKTLIDMMDVYINSKAAKDLLSKAS